MIKDIKTIIPGYRQGDLPEIDPIDMKSLNWTANDLIRNMHKGNVDFEIAAQRGKDRNNYWKSSVIHSMLQGIPLSTMYFNEINSKYRGLDGQQRSDAINLFTKSEFKLHAKTPLVRVNNNYLIDIAGLTFDKLNSVLQNRILNYPLLIHYGSNMTPEEEIDFFLKINSGKPATAADKNRIEVLSREIFIELTSHNAIAKFLPSSMIKKLKDEDMLESIFILCYYDNPSLLQSYTFGILKNTIVTEEQKEHLVRILDYMLYCFKQLDNKKKSSKDILIKLTRPTHFPMTGYMAHLAIENDISESQYTEALINLFNTGSRSPTTINKEYNESCLSGSAKDFQVEKRMEACKKALGLSL